MNSINRSEPEFLYGGISGVTLPVESFDMGEGIELRQTFSHLFSTNMMAFSPPGDKGFHPPPWKAAKGGYSYDITVEIRAPQQTSLGASFDAKETVWWIASLLRLAQYPYLTVPVISDCSFQSIPATDTKPTLTPFETEGRILAPNGNSSNEITLKNLQWIAENWRTAGQLLKQHPKFLGAFKAFDSATVPGRASASMLALWGAIEQLFAPSTGELRFRVASLLASYLQEPGVARLEMYKQILKLYNERSLAAHTAQDVELAPLAQTYVIMRNALVRIIDLNKVPTQSDLESLLFCVPPQPNHA